MWIGLDPMPLTLGYAARGCRSDAHGRRRLWRRPHFRIGSLLVHQTIVVPAELACGSSRLRIGWTATIPERFSRQEPIRLRTGPFGVNSARYRAAVASSLAAAIHGAASLAVDDSARRPGCRSDAQPTQLQSRLAARCLPRLPNRTGGPVRPNLLRRYCGRGCPSERGRNFGSSSRGFALRVSCRREDLSADLVTSASTRGPRDGVLCDELPQFAFLERLNVGKSSLLNALMRAAHSRGPVRRPVRPGMPTSTE